MFKELQITMRKTKKLLSSFGVLVITGNLLLNPVLSVYANEVMEQEMIPEEGIIESETESVPQETIEEAFVEEVEMDTQITESSEPIESVPEETVVVEELPETVVDTQGFVADPDMKEELVVKNDEFNNLEAFSREETYDLAMQMMYEDLEAKDTEPKLVASMAYAPASNTGITHVDNFFNTIIPYAIEDSVQSGILPSITIAQGALESAWGLSGLTVKANNLFGIKASNDWTGEVYNVTTWEYAAPIYDASGKLVKEELWYEVVAPFRKYSSWLGSIRDHGDFFTSTEWRRNNYRYVVGEKDYRLAAQALLNAGYATDPGYARKLIAIIENYGLDKYDKVPVLKADYHVQKHGWLTKNGTHLSLGHAGDDLRLEDFRFQLPNNSNVGINFSAHIQKRGWVNDIQEGYSAGNEGNSLRMEAVKLNLTGEGAKNYDVYYRTYSDTLGWSGWAKNGAPAGSEGYGKKIRSLEIIISWKDETPVNTSGSAFQIYTHPSVDYSTQLQYDGWTGWVSNGQLSGTVGKGRRLEALKVNLSSLPYSGGVNYQAHAQTYGWLPTVTNGTFTGTVGEGKRLEAIKLNLTGTMATQFDIYYRTHIQTYGWTGWAKNGAPAGSEGLGRRMEALQIRLVKKGGSAPGTTSNTFYK